MLEQAGDSSLAAWTLWNLAWFRLSSGQLDEAASLMTELNQYSRNLRLRYHEQNALGGRAYVQILRGDLDEARDIVAEISVGSYLIETTGALIAERQGAAEIAAADLPSTELGGGVPVFQTQIHAHRARALYLRGENARAREETELAVDAWRRTTDIVGFGVFMASIAGTSAAALADEETVRDLYAAMVTASRARVAWSSGADEIRGALALRLDLVDEAEQHYRTGIEWAEREGAPVEAAKCVQSLAEVAIKRGNTDEAREHLDAASKVFEEHNNGLYLDQVIAKKLELQGVATSDVGPGAATIVADAPTLDDTIQAE